MPQSCYNNLEGACNLNVYFLTASLSTRSNFQSCLIKLRFGMQVVLTTNNYHKKFQPNRSYSLGLRAVF